MPLNHLVYAARKNTPVLVKPAQTLSEAITVIQNPQIVATEIKDSLVMEPRSELKKKMEIMSEAEKEAVERSKNILEWQQCQYLKSLGEKKMCTQYMSLCAQEKCQTRFMEANFFDFKKYLKQKRPIK